MMALSSLTKNHGNHSVAGFFCFVFLEGGEVGVFIDVTLSNEEQWFLD